MGIGCSGGAAQAYQTADNYPGLLDGLVVGCSLADLGFDVGSARLRRPACCSSTPNGSPRPVQRRNNSSAVSGLPSVETLRRDEPAAREFSIRWRDSTDGGVPAAAALRARTQSSGARGPPIWDQYRQRLRRSRGYAEHRTTPARQCRRPVRPDGVAARPDHARASSSSSTAGIGGLDLDLRPNWTPDCRLTARPPGWRTPAGRVLNGGGGLSNLPIIDYRSYRYGPQHGAAGRRRITPSWCRNG